MTTELLKRADHPFAAHQTTRPRAGFAGAILFFGEAGRSTAKPCDRRRGPRRLPPS